MHISVMHLNLSEFTNKDGLWWTDSSQVIVPDAFDLRQFISCEVHDSPYRYHVGIKGPRRAVELLYTWPTFAADVESYV